MFQLMVQGTSGRIWCLYFLPCSGVQWSVLFATLRGAVDMPEIQENEIWVLITKFRRKETSEANVQDPGEVRRVWQVCVGAENWISLADSSLGMTFMLCTLVVAALLQNALFLVVLCRPAGVVGPGVSCCAHRWLLLSDKMYFVCSLQACWCHGAWCFMGPRSYQ